MTNYNPLSDEMPNGKRRVIVTVIAVGVLCLLLYWINLKVSALASSEATPPDWRQHAGIIKSVLENLIAGSIAAILLAITFKWIVALVDPLDRVIEINPNSITDRLVQNAIKTRSYVFIGNTASFVSAVILPVLSDANRNTGIPRLIKLILIDPVDSETLKSYSEFKLRATHTASKIGDQDLACWTAPLDNTKSESIEEISSKILAAIYLATYASLQSGIDVSIYLRKSFTPFRADMTNKEVVLTQESSNQTAVAFPAQGHFYGWYHKEAEAQCMQATKLDIVGERSKLQKLALMHPSSSKNEIRTALISLVNCFTHFKSLEANNAVIDQTVKRISRPSHAYQT